MDNPLIKHIQENLNEELSYQVSDTVCSENKSEQELREFIASEAYKEGFLDGTKVMLWAMNK